VNVYILTKEQRDSLLATLQCCEDELNCADGEGYDVDSRTFGKIDEATRLLEFLP